jgi:glycine cleavage system pyridoxal-binding protein P
VDARRFAANDDFAHRHLGPSPHDVERMLQTMGVASLTR